MGSGQGTPGLSLNNYSLWSKSCKENVTRSLWLSVEDTLWEKLEMSLSFLFKLSKTWYKNMMKPKKEIKKGLWYILYQKASCDLAFGDMKASCSHTVFPNSWCTALIWQPWQLRKIQLVWNSVLMGFKWNELKQTNIRLRVNDLGCTM